MAHDYCAKRVPASRCNVAVKIRWLAAYSRASLRPGDIRMNTALPAARHPDSCHRLGQPDGHRRLRVHRVRRARPARRWAQLFERMGFTADRPAPPQERDCCTARASINFIVNAEPDSFAQRFARLHGPSVCAIAFRVQDAKAAYERAISLGAWGYAGQAGPGRAEHPGDQGHRRLAHLLRRPLARQERRAGRRHRQHRLLRRRLRAAARRRPA